ncbi:MAG: hypothetical protein E7255_06175 [Lachnospiraceae bacterium]|nr:hypothetical protein [Lachnospiraceae bacterium]
MNLILWKKFKEIKKTPTKIIAAILTPCILLSLYTLLDIEVNVIFRLLPLVSTCFSTCLFFNIDEITYASWYIIFGLRMRTIWLANILFQLVFEFTLTEIVLIIYDVLFRPGISTDSLLVNLSTFFIAFCLLGLSTIHYSSSSKRSVIIASIFAIINFLLFGFPLLYPFLPPHFLEHIYPYALAISIVLTLVAYLYMNIDRRELLARNTQEYLDGFDTKFFEED